MAMTDIPFDTVAFDLDGTLADTAPDLAAALNHTLGVLGRPGIEASAVRGLIGHGARALLRRGLAVSGASDEALVERGYPIYREYYAAHICTGTAIFPALEEALDALRAAGTRLAICTNKPEGLSRALLGALGWEQRFDAVVGGDTLTVAKPDPASLVEAIARAGGGRAVFVGDSIVDADTARAAGLPFVAVSFGYSDRPVADLGADSVIDSYADLVPALRRL